MSDGHAAFLAQLSRPDRVIDVRPRPTPSVLLLSRACDGDLDPVQNLLAGAGIPSARLNAEELPATDLTVAPDAGALCLNGRPLSPTVTWIRHFSASAIDSTQDPAATMFLRESWQAAARQLATISGTTIGPERPGLLAQLQLARQHHVTVPRTMLTTDPYRVRNEFDCPSLVIKAAHHHFVEPSPGRLHGIFPTIVECDSLSAGPRPGPPVIVQEYVEHESELRVYYVAGQIHAFQVDKQSPADPWLAPDRVGTSLVDAPPAVVSATRTLAAAMSLRYGAFDFLITDGTPVFLEVNPDGDWGWAEQRARTTPVTTAVAAMLTDLHRGTLLTRGKFNLLGFLAGPEGS